LIIEERIVAQLEVKTIEIERNIQLLRDNLKEQRENHQLRKRSLNKFNRWIQDLEKILNKISDVDLKVIPQIEKNLDIDFSDRNLVLIAMFQPSAATIFSEINKQFPDVRALQISQEDMDYLKNGAKLAQSLAWAGDTAVKYAVLFDIWDSGISTEELHNQRKSFEANEHLAQLCNNWKLFDYRIHADPDYRKMKSLNRIKATLIEAIFGVIFIKNDIEGVKKAIQIFREKN